MDKTESNLDLYNKSLPEKNRIVYLDIARTIAILLVIFCHSIEAVYDRTIPEWKALSIQSQSFLKIAHAISRLGVPLFLYLSGKLLLSKKIENTEDCILFYKKNLLPLLLTLEIWNVLYNIIIPIIDNKAFNLKDLILNCLFLKQVSLPNMWYMPMIIGVYIAIPFLSLVVNIIGEKVIRIPMIILFLSYFLIPNLSLITNVLFKKSYNVILYLSFLGREYGLYILLGYYIGKGRLKKAKSAYIWIIAIIFLTFTCSYRIWLYNKGYAYNIWYDNVGILITSACIFELLSRIKINVNMCFKKIFTYISKVSLGIFFTHIIVQKLLTKWITFDIINKPISILFLTILVFFISILLIFIISKNKFIKQKVLLIK